MPGNLEAIAGLLLAIVPGFIASSVWVRARTWRGPPGDLRTILHSLAWSAAIQVVASPVTIHWLFPVRNDLGSYPERVAIWSALVILVLPLALGLGIAYFLYAAEQRDWWIAHHWREWPSAWDFLWTTRHVDGCYVVVEFDDHRRVGGWFGEGSNASTSPDAHGLFLNPEWVLNEVGDLEQGRRPGVVGGAGVDDHDIEEPAGAGHDR